MPDHAPMPERDLRKETADVAELAAMQCWFQAVISEPGGVSAGLRSAGARAVFDVGAETLNQWVLPSRRLSSQQRLEIYANAYFARLLECLRAEFPLLAAAAGREAFDGLALGYLLAHPSRSYSLNRLGASLAEYLSCARPPRDDDASCPSAPDWADLLVDLAQLEWAVNEVFDGPGSEALPRRLGSELAALDVNAATVRIKTCPSLRCLAFRFPVHDYYTRLKDAVRQREAQDTPAGELDVSPPAPSSSYLALVRRDYVVWRHPLSSPQYALLGELQQGGTLAEAIGAAAAYLPDQGAEAKLAGSLAEWFREWTLAGFLVGLGDR